MKFINCLNLSSVVPASFKGKLFHNFIADGKECIVDSLFLIRVSKHIYLSLSLAWDP